MKKVILRARNHVIEKSIEHIIESQQNEDDNGSDEEVRSDTGLTAFVIDCCINKVSFSDTQYLDYQGA